MKKLVLLAVTLVTVFVISACGEEANPCGEGTVLVGNECKLVEEDNNDAPAGGNLVSCSDETGLHTVPGMNSIASWLNWRFIGGHIVTDPDNAWIQSYGAAIFNVHTVPEHPWIGSFTTSGMFLSKGCEYTFEFTLRTEAPNLKPDVIVFGETVTGESFFEEVVPLTDTSNTFEFTVTPEESNYVSTGVYFGNSRGTVVIENVEIISSPISE